MDLNETLEKAVAAARRGDLGSLETEIARIRSLGDTVVGLDTRLRAMAQSVREHPSFREVPRLKAV